MLDLSKFQATGTETCFHGRHIKPQIYADLNGKNWSLKDYEARGGYKALRKILGKDGGAGMTPEAVVEDHPRLTLDDIRAAHAFAADYLADETLIFG